MGRTASRLGGAASQLGRKVFRRTEESSNLVDQQVVQAIGSEGRFHTLNPNRNLNLLGVSFLESKSRITSKVDSHEPPLEVPPGLGLRQPSGAFAATRKKAVEDYRTPRRWRDEARSVQFMGGVSEPQENNHGLHGSHGWNTERNEQRLSPSVPSEPSVVRNPPKSEVRNPGLPGDRRPRRRVSADDRSGAGQ